MTCRFLLLLAVLMFFGCRPEALPNKDDPAVPPAPAQDKQMAEEVKRLVTKMANATVSGDYDAILALTHQKVLDAMGGKERAREQTKLGMDVVKKQGFSFRVAEVGEPKLAKGESGYYAVVPYTLALSAPGKKGTSRTTMVGVSHDDGKTWSFVQVSAKDSEDGIRRMFPDFPKVLKVPPTERKLEDDK